MRKDINKQQLINDYLNGSTVNFLTKKYSVSSWFVNNVLDKNNIIRQEKWKPSGLNLNNLNREIILSLYNSGQSASKIAQQLGCSHTLILDWLDKNKIIKTDKNQLIRKYKNIKINYFDIIDSEEKAYILGLIYADGCISIGDNHSSVAEINLQEKDRDILEKLSMAILGEIALKYVITEENNQNQWRLRVHNYKLCQQLEKLGCVPAKSLILTWPMKGYPELQRHFIRGYYDGDGGISYYENEDNYPSYKVKITSTLEFCLNCDGVINEQISTYFSYDMFDNNITASISVGGNRQILKLMNWLYKDATIYLHRKHNKYLQLKAWCEEVDSRTTRYSKITTLSA